jgi:hypothetical protein
VPGASTPAAAVGAGLRRTVSSPAGGRRAHPLLLVRKRVYKETPDGVKRMKDVYFNVATNRIRKD